MTGSQNVALSFDVEEFLQEFPLTVVFDFVKLNLYVTFSVDADKAIVDDDAYECGVSGGEFFQVVFPGVACEVGVDIFVKIFVAIPKISQSPECSAVYIYGSC